MPIPLKRENHDLFPLDGWVQGQRGKHTLEQSKLIRLGRQVVIPISPTAGKEKEWCAGTGES